MAAYTNQIFLKSRQFLDNMKLETTMPKYSPCSLRTRKPRGSETCAAPSNTRLSSTRAAGRTPQAVTGVPHNPALHGNARSQLAASCAQCASTAHRTACVSTTVAVNTARSKLLRRQPQCIALAARAPTASATIYVLVAHRR